MKYFAFALISALISAVSFAEIIKATSGNETHPISQFEKNKSTNRVATIAIKIDLGSLSSWKSDNCQQQHKACLELFTNKFGFKCDEKFISQRKIMKAANQACPEIREDPPKNAFPSLHTAFTFSTTGPYIEWPLEHSWQLPNNQNQSNYRLIMNMKCEVVGAVMRKDDDSYHLCSYDSK